MLKNNSITITYVAIDLNELLVHSREVLAGLEHLFVELGAVIEVLELDLVRQGFLKVGGNRGSSVQVAHQRRAIAEQVFFNNHGKSTRCQSSAFSLASFSPQTTQ